MPHINQTIMYIKRYAFFIWLVACALLLDGYVYQGVYTLTAPMCPTMRIGIRWIYWGIIGWLWISICIGVFGRLHLPHTFFRRFFFPLCTINYTAKLFATPFLLLDDITRGLRWILNQVFFLQAGLPATHTVTPRSIVLSQTAMMAATVPLLTLGYGIGAGAYHYKVHRIKIKLPNLPSSFHGIRIGQLSDIHSGSFLNSKAVKRGIELLMRETPDVVFFTGDLVNDIATEINPYSNIFEKVRAPLGVYAVLGNHDYGDYVRWPSMREKEKNLLAMRAAHQQLGWRLLMNEHIMLTQGSDQVAVIGSENWGARHFSKYGKLAQAYCGTENAPVKLLLTHDPSHWDAQVRPQYPQIDITFSGHTHGGQVGIEVSTYKWSPVQYLYKQWAGLYQEGRQYLYINRGYGCTAYPGRLGIWPEITIMELEKA